jgi:hypothetical protein
MSDQSAIEAATKRLLLALDALDAAVDRKLETGRDGVKLAEQLHVLDSDRSRLAADLDAQTARTRGLETANREIARRLDTAMASIRSVLDTQER